MTIDLSPTQVIAALGVLLALLMMWRSGARRGRRVADASTRPPGSPHWPGTCWARPG